MPLKKFVPYTVAGCFVWNSLLVYLGLFLGVHWEEVAGAAHYLIIATVAAAVALAVVYFFNRRRKIQRLKASKRKQT